MPNLTRVVLAPAILLLANAPMLAQDCDPFEMFEPEARYSIINRASSVAIGDLNGDGANDLAITTFVGNAVNIQLNNGDGTFRRGGGFGTGRDPYSVAIADLDGDGANDIVTAGLALSSGPTVSVLLGNGDGTFQPRLDYSGGSRCWSVAVGDVNGDGVPDIVTAANGTTGRGTTAGVLLGNGDGTFRAGTSAEVAQGPVAVAIGDVNGDGVADLAVASGEEALVSVVLGNGDGTFQPRLDYPTGNRPRSVAIDDFDGDGDLDLAVTNSTSNTVSVLLGRGDGTFVDAANYFTGFSPRSVATGDVDGDGVLDLATANHSFDTVGIMLGVGDGTFGFGIEWVVGGGPRSVAIGDLTGNGVPDVVSANESVSSVSVMVNRCAPSCPADLDTDGELTIFDFLAFQNLFDLMDPRADFDGDGDFTIFDFLAFQNAFDAGCP